VSIAVANARCNANGSHRSARSPSRARSVDTAGIRANAHNAPAWPNGRCLMPSTVPAPRVNAIDVAASRPTSSNRVESLPGPAAWVKTPPASRR